MSIQAITVEEITIHNVNPDTSRIAELFGRYLTETWGIDYLKLTVDDKTYETEDDEVREGIELYDVCKKLSAYQEIKAVLNSDNSGGIDWRRESMFLKELKNIPSLTENIVYKSVDEYDADPGVDLCGFGKDGLIILNREGNASFEDMKDISKWFSFSGMAGVVCEDDQRDEAVYHRLKDAFSRLMEICACEDEECVVDEWHKMGGIELGQSISFDTERIPEMLDVLNEIAAIASDCDAEIYIDLCAKPVGEGDYPFATVSFVLDEDGVSVKYGRV